MAIAHFSASIVSRGSGRSAVLSAAYRHCAKMEYEREARTIDYRAKQGLLHEEFVLPAGAPRWVRSLTADRSVAGASEAFWNKVEAFEKRTDAQLARDLTIALPLELSAEQNIALVRILSRNTSSPRAWLPTGFITTITFLVAPIPLVLITMRTGSARATRISI